MPNAIAFLALAVWPLVTIALFRRLPIDRALIASLLVGYLFLPEPPAVFDLPLFPPLNKHNIPALTAFACILWIRGRGDGLMPQSLAGRVLVATFVLSPVVTVLTNTEPVFFGQVGLPGLGWKDAIALTLSQFLLILPFLMARQHLAGGGSQRDLLAAFAVGGLVYSFPMLLEVRLSPQLNNWIYGYYQHFFAQSLRGGGYRPVVFLYHGLWVAFFIMTAAVSAFALWRTSGRAQGNRWLLAGIYLCAVLVLAKSLGALVFLLLLAPLVVLLTPLLQIKAAIVIGVLAMGYPILKGADLVPQDALLAKAAAVDPDRAASLQFRFDNENVLLERAYHKPVFGWGSWGRNHILDPVSGAILTVTDGRWIIVIGVYGWVGFLAEFGLILLPIAMLWREAVVRGGANVSPHIAPLSLLLAVNLADMIPNATLTTLTWLVAGALMGHAEALRAARKREAKHTVLAWQSIM